MWSCTEYIHFLSGFFPLPGLPGGSDSKECACNTGDLGSVPGLGRFPEKGLATHSSILAWKISWTEEPGGLQSMGSQRVRHDWETNTFPSPWFWDSFVLLHVSTVPFYCLVVFHYVDMLHSSINGHLGCFQFVTFTDEAAMNIHIQAYEWPYAFVFLG